MIQGSISKTDTQAFPRALQALQSRILLVEDYPDTLHILSRLLRGLGYHVTPVSTAKAALELIAGEEFDLLVSDIGLPDGTGLDVMRSIRQRYGKAARGIALSGFGSDEDKRCSREAGFSHHLTKPVNVKVLESTIRSVLES